MCQSVYIAGTHAVLFPPGNGVNSFLEADSLINVLHLFVVAAL